MYKVLTSTWSSNLYRPAKYPRIKQENTKHTLALLNSTYINIPDHLRQPLLLLSSPPCHQKQTPPSSAAVHHCYCRCSHHPSSSATIVMSHLSKRDIRLDDSGNENVGSDLEEIVQWDCSLCLTKTFQMAVLILSGRKFESPNLESLQKIILMFINDHPCNYYFKRTSQSLKCLTLN